MLVPNWREVLKRSLVVWVGVLGALLPELPDVVLKWLASDASAQVLSPEAKNVIRTVILLFVVPFVRIWQQQSLATATEKKLAEEKAMRKGLEQVATIDGITKADVAQVKREAVASTVPQPQP